MDVNTKADFEVGKLYTVVYKPLYSFEREEMVAFKRKHGRDAGLVYCKVNVFIHLESNPPWNYFYSISEKTEITVGSSWAKNYMKEI